MPFWSLLPVVMLGSSILCWVLIKLGGARFLDQPVARSAHTHATPRGGGASVVIAFYIFVGTLYAFGHLTSEQLMVLMCAFPVAVTGFIDDLRPLPVHFRLPLHLTVAVFALLLLGPVPEPFFSGWLLLPFWLQSLLLILALVWLLNLYNFMDGIDTLAAGQAVFVAGVAGAILWLQGDAMAWVCAGLVASVVGFMMWNLPPAKLFLGDVGSTFLGFVLGLIALLAHFSGALSVWVWVLLMGGFIADTTCTLLVRTFRGRSVTQAHSTHAYQHLARRFGSHAKVSLMLTVINVVWLLPLAWAAHLYPHLGVMLAISGIVPLIILAALTGAGKEQHTE